MKNDDTDPRAHAFRKSVSQVDVLNVKNCTTGEVYFSRATIVDVSPTGVLLRVEREHILTLGLRSTLTLSALNNAGVGFTIEVMDTYIEGTIVRTKPEGKGDFLVGVDFREDAPEYWRNCLVDLLPDHDDSMQMSLASDEPSFLEDDEEDEDENLELDGAEDDSSGEDPF